MPVLCFRCIMHENLISFPTHITDFEHQAHPNHPIHQFHLLIIMAFFITVTIMVGLCPSEVSCEFMLKFILLQVLPDFFLLPHYDTPLCNGSRGLLCCCGCNVIDIRSSGKSPGLLDIQTKVQSLLAIQVEE